MQHTHFIGIGGIGMSALAHVLLERGASVSGSDLRASPVTQALEKKGAQIAYGHLAETIRPGMRIVYSTDVPAANPEYRRAKELGLEIMHRSQLLGDLMKGDLRPLLVTGTHGKTTTSSLLAHVLVACGRNPGYAIGGTVTSLGKNGSHGNGVEFVAEADESDGSFLNYTGYGAIITNIDHDHMAHWKTEENLIEGFFTFASRILSKDHLIWCADDPHLSSLKLPGVSYGFSKEADFQITSFEQQVWTTSFDCSFEGKNFKNVIVPLLGRHNVLNAAAVFALCLRLGLTEEAIRSAFASFQGIGRRVEKKGEWQGIPIYDDYGHHPTEIIATVKGIKAAIGKRRLVLAFQPHRYTRTRDCFGDYADAFHEADLLVLTEIYSAGESPIEGITSEGLMENIQAKRRLPSHFSTRATLADAVRQLLRPDDVLLTMGAGDITKLGVELIT
jgi:UDP-N-acetylmuramate--alanine ligase